MPFMIPYDIQFYLTQNIYNIFEIIINIMLYLIFKDNVKNVEPFIINNLVLLY